MLKGKGNYLAFSAKNFKKKWLKESTELIVFFQSQHQHLSTFLSFQEHWKALIISCEPNTNYNFFFFLRYKQQPPALCGTFPAHSCSPALRQDMWHGFTGPSRSWWLPTAGSVSLSKTQWSPNAVQGCEKSQMQALG